jgi:hypothetical protein
MWPLVVVVLVVVLLLMTAMMLCSIPGPFVNYAPVFVAVVIFIVIGRFYRGLFTQR